jgi:hypothetical protein
MSTKPADTTPEYWFPAKRYGWGWGFPTCWQGWALFIGYFAGIGISAYKVSPHLYPQLFAGCVVALTVMLLAICFVKGEPPRWRWGKD